MTFRVYFCLPLPICSIVLTRINITDLELDLIINICN